MLTLEFINVGYGDAIFIRETRADGAAFTMLVDCGDEDIGSGGQGSHRITAAEFLSQRGVETLDLLVLTHLHLDHCGGLPAVLERVWVKEFWCNHLPQGGGASAQGIVPEGGRNLLRAYDIFTQAVASLQAQGTQIRCFHSSQPELRPWGGGLCVSLFCEELGLFEEQERIWRRAEMGTATGQELDRLDRFINNTSLRLRLRYGTRSVELPGDVYAACWEKHILAPCDVVKLPHHGHRDAWTPQLAERLRPTYGVVSTSSDRRDDCPSQGIIAQMQASGTALFFTDAVTRSGISPHYHETVRVEVAEQGDLAIAYGGALQGTALETNTPRSFALRGETARR